jgi:hypothetical protein
MFCSQNQKIAGHMSSYSVYIPIGVQTGAVKYFGCIGATTFYRLLFTGLTDSPIRPSTDAAPGRTLHQDRRCTRMHSVPGRTLHQDARSTRTHAAPGCMLHRDGRCTRTHAAPGCTLHQNARCTRTDAAPGRTRPPIAECCVISTDTYH